jgi:phenylalanine-4-hydroxylase
MKSRDFFILKAPNKNQMKQVFENYSDEDRLVWFTLFDRQMKNLQGKVSVTFLDSLKTVGLFVKRFLNSHSST